MSNLGWYQWFTTTAKKVGGPLKLMGMIAVGGYAVIRTGEAGVKQGVKLVKKHIKGKEKKYPIYDVITPAVIEENVEVQKGDKIKVCAIDNAVVMIEIIGNKNNPYFVDFDFMKSFVDYK